MVREPIAPLSSPALHSWSRIHGLNSQRDLVPVRDGTRRDRQGSRSRTHGALSDGWTDAWPCRRSQSPERGRGAWTWTWTGRSAAGPRGARALSVTHVSGHQAARPRPTTASDPPWLPMTWWARLAFWLRLRCASRRVAHCCGRNSRVEQRRTGVVVVVGYLWLTLTSSRFRLFPARIRIF